MRVLEPARAAAMAAARDPSIEDALARLDFQGAALHRLGRPVRPSWA
jgi:hypothetical protein